MHNNLMIHSVSNLDYMQKIKSLFNAINISNSLCSNISLNKIFHNHNKESIQYTIDSIQWLLDMHIPILEKEKFIRENINLNFELLNIKPIDWLYELHKSIQSSVLSV